MMNRDFDVEDLAAAVTVLPTRYQQILLPLLPTTVRVRVLENNRLALDQIRSVK